VQTSLSGLKVTEASANELLAQTQATLDTARDGHDTVAGRLGVVQAEHDAVDTAISARTATHAAITHIAELRQRANAEATRVGFANPDAATAAIVTDDELDRLQHTVDHLAGLDKNINVVLHDADVVAAASQPPVDLTAARTAVANAQVGRDATLTVVNGIESQLAAVQRCADVVADADTQGGALRQRHQVVHGLAQLAGGNQAGGASGVRMSLTNYVLSARLTEVTDAASTRLAAMTDGRYTLLQTDESGHGARQGGLGIEVRDTYAPERTRSTQSLSGGESFAASLALALGLADVVAAESGGVSMETLFIDEGFGTLDDEALNGVLDILDSLRSGGRTVGVVSHVATMKERITTHVQVVGGPQGSHIRQ
jgi:exonuclease SbcC